jgi:16S rRNA (guanine(527)-N(7))-methyltransferase RsmG
VKRGTPAEAFDDLMAALEAVTGQAAACGARRRFEQYLDVFLRWNRIHRMTALDSPPAIVRELFLDSLLFLPLLPRRPLRLLDIGAGSGIPGLPIRLADPSVLLTLMDSRRKRVSFLRAACRELELVDVVVIEGRAEKLAERTGLSEAFDAVVSRAVGPPARLLPVAMRYLKPGGVLVISGPPKANAPEEGEPVVQAIRVPVPGSTGTRLFLRAAKQGTVPRGT